MDKALARRLHHLGTDPAQSAVFDKTLVDTQARSLGPEVTAFWQDVKASAHRQVDTAD
jgi:hypothetical protein